ncbi:MAG: AI-2E family transporter [Actinomycetota bacterium]|nr:AI-2E family transporter [Actinomycetota bacterium]
MTTNPGSWRERIRAQVRGRLEATRERRAADSDGLEQESLIVVGSSNFTPAHVPFGVDLAAAWAWRFVVICAAGAIILYLLSYLTVVVLPVLVALLITALVSPVVEWAHRRGLPRRLAALLVVIVGIALITLLLVFIGQQISSSVDQLSAQVVNALEEIRRWLQKGPLHATDSQINNAISQAQAFITQRGQHLVGKISEVGAAVGHIVAGLFIILFGTYFFLADGRQIWTWVVRLFPRAARVRVDSSGRVAWRSLTQFVRASVLVAGTDAVGVMIVAAILKLPLVSAIGVLVFLGAFVPLVGATLSGTVAVLVALVAQGPVVALIMLGGLILVQQIEAHVLQPFLMGRFVSVHPLGVIIAIATGVVLAGIPGALIAVPLTAALNAVVQHLASYTEVGESASESEESDPDPAVDAEPVPEESEG